MQYFGYYKSVGIGYNGKKEEEVTQMKSIIAHRMKRPDGAFYIFINVKDTGKTGDELAPLLLEKAKIALVPGSVFGASGKYYLRMSFANSYENIVEGCRRLAEAL